ncbi:hypothetical protein M5K25_016929 [Dendrobium thyrsiflorum]|uniref:Reverse transcriptase zinc-binding domain-containing protein n=1 Tax=Dendrobium thyrsiflorum TaxID=117978 RepID=A0ABD0UT66_DENTH
MFLDLFFLFGNLNNNDNLLTYPFRSLLLLTLLLIGLGEQLYPKLSIELFLNCAPVPFSWDGLLFYLEVLFSELLASSWFRAKYSSPWKNCPVAASKFWKFICLTATKMLDKFSLYVSSNCNLSMFWDPWFHGKTLADFGLSPLDSSDLAKDYIANQVWVLLALFPEWLGEMVKSIPILEQSVVSWDGSNHPGFKVFSMHYFSNIQPVSWFKYIWHKRNSLRFSSFAWMVVLGKLKTADVLIKRSISAKLECSFCNSSVETHNHLFFTCDYSLIFIGLLCCKLLISSISPLSCLSGKKISIFLVICCSVYYPWLERNCRNFSGSWDNPTSIANVIRNAIRFKVRNWKHYDKLKEKYPGLF